MSDSLWPHELQHARPPCPSPTPRVHSDSCPSSQWCHPAISSSVFPFSSCPQSLPASESFPMSQLFTWGGQSTGVPKHGRYLIPQWKSCHQWWRKLIHNSPSLSLCWEIMVLQKIHSEVWLVTINLISHTWTSFLSFYYSRFSSVQVSRSVLEDPISNSLGFLLKTN